MSIPAGATRVSVRRWRATRAIDAACARGEELLRSGRYAHARRLFIAALRIAENDLDEDAPEVVPILNGLGLVGKYTGDFSRSELAYRRALRIAEEPELRAGLLHNLAGVLHARGDAAMAEPIARAGIALRGPGSERLADEAALAAILIDLSRLTDARAILAATLAEYERTYGPDHYEIGVTLHNLGSLEFRLGHHAEAADLLGRSVRIKENHLGGYDPDLAITVHNLGCAQAALGQSKVAIASFRRAISLLTGAVEPHHPTLLSCHQRLALLTN
jgi:tetratricopeptide (TPR) repeat protein